MKVKSVFVKNFLAIESATLELDDRGLLLIQGENKDDTSANSNGAGKSSLADAICWAIYGVTARGVTGDRVVNRSAKRNTLVEIRLVDGASEFVIQRYRKDDTNKNQTFVYKKGATPGEVATELHKATERETQEVINKLIGCSLDVFQAAVYMGQEKMPDLPGMTDKQLKLTIEEAAGTEILVAAYEKARERRLVAERFANHAEAELKKCQAALDAAETVHARATTNHAAFEAERKNKAKAELAPIPGLEEAQKDIETQLAASIAERYEDKLFAVTTAFREIKSQQERQKTLKDACDVAMRIMTRCASELKRAKETYELAQKRLTEVDDRVGEPCETCGKAYCEEDLTKVREIAKSVVDSTRESLRRATVDYKAAKEKYDEAIAAHDDYAAKMTDATELSMEQSRIMSALAEQKNLKIKADTYAKAILAAKNAARNALTAPNPFEKDAADYARLVSSEKAKVEIAKTELEKAELEQAIADDAVRVFGPSGVRAHILDTVTPFLNDRTAHYLSIMADGNIKAVWNTLQTNAKGEVKEKFNIEVSNDKGGDSFDSLSGGEKRKVRLATAMALQDMVAARATKPINIFIADEVDHALDAAGLERLMTIMNEKAKDRGTVLIISHSDLKDWVDNVITVRKEKGHSEVGGSVKATGAFA